MARQTFDTLQEFLSYLEREGQLKRIPAEVDPHLEVAAIAVRSMLEGGPALLFENVKGSEYPLAMNILASDRRVELAIQSAPGELGERLIHLVEEAMPPKPMKIYNAAKPLLPRIISIRGKKVSSGISQEVVGNTNLNDLPILQTWPDDGGKFITLPQVFTYDPRNGKRNVGMYRIHVFGPNETGMHWQIQKGGGFHYYHAEQVNRSLETAVVVGTDPALLLATISPLPENIDEVMFASFLRGKPTPMTRGKSIAIDVPANAEFVIEGSVAPHERRREGPFGDHFGHYSHAGMWPVFKISKITHRSKPIFAATVVGKPPMEDKWLGDATQLILGPLAKLNHPEVKDVWAFFEAGFHNFLGVSTHQRYAKEAMKTALSLSTDAQLSLTKCAVMVDAEVNNRDFRALVRAIGKNFDPHYDFMLVQNVPLDTLDFTSYSMNMGSKMLIDATTKQNVTASGGKYRPRVESELLARVGSTPEDVKTLDLRIREWKLIEDCLLVVKVAGAYSAKSNAANEMENELAMPAKTAGREIIEKLVSESNIAKLPKGTKIIAAVSEDVDLNIDMQIMWGIFTRFDAARDSIFTRSSLVGVSAVHEGVMGIDSTWKPGYPNPCEMPEEVSRLVNGRWKEYGLK
jgi:4-hydroxybenzoate decarboxylase subunit C